MRKQQDYLPHNIQQLKCIKIHILELKLLKDQHYLFNFIKIKWMVIGKEEIIYFLWYKEIKGKE